jgi:hypothetical protein
LKSDGQRMAYSVLEEAAVRKLTKWRAAMTALDRGVLLGFLLSLVPLFPVAFFGRIIGGLNYTLWKSKKKDFNEGNLIRIGLWIGFINTLIGIAVSIFLIDIIFNMQWHHYYDRLFDAISTFFRFIFQLKPSQKGAWYD